MTLEDTGKKFWPIAEKMRMEGMPDIAIANFANHYQQLLGGRTGFIPETSIQAINDLASTDDLNDEHAALGDKALPNTVLLKLNGGLGASMGLDKAKSLIRVKESFSFLDIIAQHAIQSNVHLLLMNSFSTREDSLQVLQKYPELLKAELALDFVQHKVPKINQIDFTPATNDNKLLEWCPPGHGDIYIALVSSGMLNNLQQAGYRYALISNSDNLGAVLDTQLLGFMVEQQLPFLMEVTDRTEADKKGGHLARTLDDRLILRESAQCMDDDRSKFEDVKKHRYFNTNNLWIDLQQLQKTLELNAYVLDLPLICNSKTVDPRDAHSSPVYQLETAMGSAIGVFKGAQAIRVPRSRFAPVKTTSDLLLVQSDIYALNDNFTLSSKLPPSRIPNVNLDNHFFKLVDEFEARFPHGSPSLLDCESLEVKGDIVFGKNIKISGNVILDNSSGGQIIIPHDACIDENLNWD